MKARWHPDHTKVEEVSIRTGDDTFFDEHFADVHLGNGCEDGVIHLETPEDAARLIRFLIAAFDETV